MTGPFKPPVTPKRNEGVTGALRDRYELAALACPVRWATSDVDGESVTSRQMEASDRFQDLHFVTELELPWPGVRSDGGHEVKLGAHGPWDRPRWAFWDARTGNAPSQGPGHLFEAGEDLCEDRGAPCFGVVDRHPVRHP